MNRIKLLLAILLLTTTALAQPSPVKKAAKGVLKITTFKADGALCSTGYGALIDDNGTAITAWTPFIGAATAIAIDGKGTRYDVDCLYGADDIYNVARIKIKATGKFSGQPLTLETTQQDTTANTWVINYDVKQPQFINVRPMKVETFMTDLPYYIYEQETPVITEEDNSCVVVNAKGELMGLIKTSNTRTDYYVASARYAQTLQPTALSANSNTLRKTSMRIALPNDYNQALLALMMASQRNDTVNYAATVENFISFFPDKMDGYEYKAMLLTDQHDYLAATQCMEKAIEVSESKDYAHYTFAKLIYNKVMNQPEPKYEDWSLEKAQEECDTAIALNPTPLYRVMRGRILYARQSYEDALNEFNTANLTEPRSADVYYYAYQCLANMKKPKAEQLEMLDSALSVSPKQLVYLREKALLLMKMNRMADAIPVAQEAITVEPRYAEGHGIMGLALCMTGNTTTGLAELRRAKAMGYEAADTYIQAYGGDEATEQQTNQ